MQFHCHLLDEQLFCAIDASSHHHVEAFLMP
jgi:hypothetical protein